MLRKNKQVKQKKKKSQKELKMRQMGLGVQNRKDGVNKKKCSGPAH